MGHTRDAPRERLKYCFADMLRGRDSRNHCQNTSWESQGTGTMSIARGTGAGQLVH